MELFLSVLSVLGLVFIGFLIAEFQNAFFGKKEPKSRIYFSFIGVYITQKDVQRLLFAIFLSIGIMVSFPELIEFTGYDINAYIVYLMTGYAPSTVMFFITKKATNKGNDNDKLMSREDDTTGGHPDPDREEK